MLSGASIPPEAMMHFPLFQISSYFRKISDAIGQISQFDLFTQRSFNFDPPKISYEIVHSLFPIFSNSLPWFRKIYVFYTYFTCLSFPLVWP